MEPEMKWFLLMIAVLVTIAVGPVTAGYVQSGPSAGTLKDDPADTQTSTKVEYTHVDADGQTWGYCYCRVYARSWAKAVDSASADAFGEGYWQKSWHWQGPPSTPPGGTLSWYIYAEGSADAWGNSNPGSGGSAVSDANGYSCAFYARSTGSTYDGGAKAYGSVQNNNDGTGDALVYSPAQMVPGTQHKYHGQGYYDYSVDWTLTGDDDDSVASGTSNVSVLAGVACDGNTDASASGAGSGSEAEAETITEATASSITADLTSN